MVSRSTKIFLGITVCLIAVAFSACKKENFRNISTSNRNPLWALQIASADLSFEDLTGAVKDSLLSKGTNTLTFVYPMSFVSPSASSMLTLPNPSKNENLTLTSTEITQFLTNFTIAKTILDTIDFPFPSGTSIKSIKLKSGKLNINVAHYFKQNTKLRISIPLLKQGVTAYSTTLVLNYGGSLPTLSQTEIDLSGYTLNLAFGTSTPQNRLAFSILDTMTYIGNPLVSTDNTSFDFIFSDLVFGDVDGNFSTITFPSHAESIPIDFFQNAATGGLDLTDPKLNININNSFGFPIKAHMQELKASTATSGIVNFTNDSLAAFSLVMPTVKGLVKLKSLSLSTLNSNVGILVNKSIQNVSYSLSCTQNQNPAAFTYFMTDSSHYSGTIDLTLPIKGTVTGLILMDTLRTDFTSFAQNKIDSLRIYASNMIPLNAYLQIYFLDANGQIRDSLFRFDPFFVTSAEVSTKAIASKATISYLTSGLDDKQFGLLVASGKMILKTTLNTPTTLPTGVSSVRLIYTNTLSVKIGAQMHSAK